MRYCIGVDLGGTNIAIGLLDLDDRVILHKKSVKTRAPRPCEEISRDIKEICLTLCERQGIGLDEVEWIGIATPGIVRDGVVISAVNLGWTDEKFGQIVSRITGLRCK